MPAELVKDVHMKTQAFDSSLSVQYDSFVHWSSPRLMTTRFRSVADTLKNYRENRNGDLVDDPATPFPSAGLDRLDIENSNWQGLNKWPDPLDRYWWKIVLKDGSV